MKPAQVVRVDALTPLVFRDGRPFDDGADEMRAHGTIMPAPTVVAGFVRTRIGETAGWRWTDPQVVDAAKRISVRGYAFQRDINGMAELVFPAPLDAVPYRDDAVSEDLQLMRLQPERLAPGEGCDLGTGLAPLSITADVKPESGYALWRWPDLRQWLLGRCPELTPVDTPVPDERVHVAIDSDRGTARESMLFTVEFHDWEVLPAPGSDTSRWSLRVALDDNRSLGGIGHLGGERRPAACSVEDAGWPSPEAELVEALTGTTHVRCVLTTPALFEHGWRPGWAVTPVRHGPMRHLAGARLVSAAVGRAQAVSGWEYDRRPHRLGPKAIRRMAPAGSVYFFELREPLSEAAIRELWLTSLSDSAADQRDGTGNAVWGVWEWHEQV